jgi:hypothetical protein
MSIGGKQSEIGTRCSTANRFIRRVLLLLELSVSLQYLRLLELMTYEMRRVLDSLFRHRRG